MFEKVGSLTLYAGLGTGFDRSGRNFLKTVFFLSDLVGMNTHLRTADKETWGDFNTELAKLLTGLKRDLGVKKLRQNYRGTGTQAHRRQIWVHWPDFVIDIWIDDGFIKLGGVLWRGSGHGPKIEYRHDSPQQIYRKVVKELGEIYEEKRDKVASRVAARFQERTATKVDDLYREVEAKRLELENRLKKIMGDRQTFAYASMWPDTSMGESEYMDADYNARNRQRAIRSLTKGLQTLAQAEKAIEMLERTDP